MKLAQFISIAVYGLIAIWFVVPWIRKKERATALIILMSVHVFRYCVLYLPVAKGEGYAIPDVAMMQITVGDLGGAIIAFAAIALLRYRIRLGLVLAWLLIIWTIGDVICIFHQRSIDPPRADATGVWWVIFAYFAPLIMVSLPLLIWQLCTRRGEPLTKIKVT